MVIGENEQNAAPMTARLILSVGMPRAGSGWHYNLIHDLVIEAGGRDARDIRQRYLLHPILTEVNCNIGTLASHRLIPVMVPVYLGNTYAIKAHSSPSGLAMSLIQKYRITPTYIYRDPRDALLSAFEYGQRKKLRGQGGAFSDITTIDAAIDFMLDYVRISEAWLACKNALHVRYENLLTNYDSEIMRLLDFLEFDSDNQNLHTIADNYRPERGRPDRTGTHFAKGMIGRYRQVLTKSEQEKSRRVFASFLERLGYPLD
jgi:hypothetical protein